MEEITKKKGIEIYDCIFCFIIERNCRRILHQMPEWLAFLSQIHAGYGRESLDEQ